MTTINKTIKRPRLYLRIGVKRWIALRNLDLISPIKPRFQNRLDNSAKNTAKEPQYSLYQNNLDKYGLKPFRSE